MASNISVSPLMYRHIPQLSQMQQREPDDKLKSSGTNEHGF